LRGKLYRSKSKPIIELVPLVLLSLLMVAAGFASGPIIDWIASVLTFFEGN
jgi:hypothetical protein